MRLANPGAGLTNLESAVDKDRVKGAAKDVGGKIEQEAGKLTGDRSRQAKGVQHQAEGKVDKGVGHVKDAAREAERKTHH